MTYQDYVYVRGLLSYQHLEMIDFIQNDPIIPEESKEVRAEHIRELTRRKFELLENYYELNKRK